MLVERGAPAARVQRFVRAPLIVTRYWFSVNRKRQARHMCQNRSGSDGMLPFVGRPHVHSAASKLNAEVLRDLLDLPESRVEIVTTCIRFSLPQTLHELWRFDLNRSSSQIA